MKEFFSFIGKDYEGIMTLDPIDKIVPIIIGILIIMVLIVFGENLRFLSNKNFSKGVGIFLFIVWSSYFIWNMAYGKFNSQTLPISLCSLTSIGFIYVFIKNNKLVLDVVFYWGIIGGLLALLFVSDVYRGPEHYRYYEFYLDHLILFIAPFYFMFVRNYIPTITSTLKSFFGLVVAGLLTLPVNLAYNMDYMIMNPYTAPEGTPAATIAEIANHNIILYVLILMTLSFIVYAFLYTFFYIISYRLRQESSLDTIFE